MEPDVSPNVWIPETINNKYRHFIENNRIKARILSFFISQFGVPERFISPCRDYAPPTEQEVMREERRPDFERQIIPNGHHSTAFTHEGRDPG